MPHTLGLREQQLAEAREEQARRSGFKDTDVLRPSNLCKNIDELYAIAAARSQISGAQALQGFKSVIPWLQNYAAALPIFFNMPDQKPMTLDDYAPFEEIYNRFIPDRRLLRTGRQCGKSVNLCTSSLLTNIFVPYFRQLYVTPLYEQCRRFSSNYVRPFINNSPLNYALVDKTCEQNVLQKTLRNGSQMIFTFCYRDVDRVRGVAADSVTADEIQDLNFDFLPILQETMSASKDWRLTTFAGTPKTTDNTIARLWQETSMGEWVIPCQACGKENISSIGEDLEDMIKPAGLSCAKCDRLIDTRIGYWQHAETSRMQEFLGLHVPQAVLPLHCEDPRAWAALIDKRDRLKKSVYLNEVLGEDCDAGSKLIPIEVIQRASKIPIRNIRKEAEAYRRTRPYIYTVVAVDWGGRGLLEDSLTAITIVGLLPDGLIECIFGLKLPPAVEDTSEVDIIADMYRSFQCDSVAHDFRGVGMSKDTILRQRGLRRITPWSNEGFHTKYFVKTSRTPTKITYVQINRSAGITLIAHEVAHQRIVFPRWESDRNMNVFLDLNSWFEDFVARPDGADLYHIQRSGSLPDDIGMSLMYGACTCWRAKGRWPKYMQSLTETGIVDATIQKGRRERQG